MKRIRKSAVGLVEYSLILALVALVAIAVLSSLGKNVTQKYADINSTIDNVKVTTGSETGTTPDPNSTPVAGGGTVTIVPGTISGENPTTPPSSVPTQGFDPARNNP
jgi:Flp pilus assembly pilin Flp